LHSQIAAQFEGLEQALAEQFGSSFGSQFGDTTTPAATPVTGRRRASVFLAFRGISSAG
jgi:hypothetical protein